MGRPRRTLRPEPTALLAGLVPDRAERRHRREQPCEGTFPIASLTNTLNSLDIRMASGRGGERGLLAWFGENSVTETFAFLASDGEVQNLGGGCGAGGTAAATCAAPGTPAFGVRLQHAEPNAQAWLMVGATPANFACGPCAVVPLPVAALPAALDVHGNAEFSFALPANPSLSGQSLLAQWFVAAPGGCAGPNWSFSNGLGVTIE